MDRIHVLGFAGSLRKGSHNRGLLRAAAQVIPNDMALEIFDLAPIPLFNEDVLRSGPPEPVQLFKERIASADALLIATPEYNYSMPGVLKNAIDWASRPLQTSPLDGKPVAIMGAGGIMGSSRAQHHLRQVCVYVNLLPLNRPELWVQRSWEKFDQDGNLMDDDIREGIRKLLVALAAWTRQLKGR